MLDLIRDMQVPPPVKMRAEFLLQVCDELPQRHLRLRHRVRQQQRIQDSVALRQVARNSNPARFLAPDQHFLPRHHHVAHVLEPNAVLDQFAPVLLRDAVQHARRVERPRYRATPLFPVLQQPPEDDRVALVRVHECAVFRHRPDAVGVAVVGKPGVAFLAHDRFLQHAHVRLDRFRVDSREQRVDLAANFHHFQSVLAQDVAENKPPRAVHVIHRDLESGFADQIKVGELRDGRDVRRPEIHFLDRGRCAFRHRPQLRLDLRDDPGRRRSAVFCLEFHAVPRPRVVARRDHYPARRVEMFHAIGNRRGGQHVVADAHRNPGRCDRLRRCLRKRLRREARVIADQDALLRVFVLEHVAGNRSRRSPHVCESKVVGNNAAPPIRSKLDLFSHKFQFLVSVSSSYSARYHS